MCGLTLNRHIVIHPQGEGPYTTYTPSAITVSPAHNTSRACLQTGATSSVLLETGRSTLLVQTLSIVLGVLVACVLLVVVVVYVLRRASANSKDKLKSLSNPDAEASKDYQVSLPAELIRMFISSLLDQSCLFEDHRNYRLCSLGKSSRFFSKRGRGLQLSDDGEDGS